MKFRDCAPLVDAFTETECVLRALPLEWAAESFDLGLCAWIVEAIRSGLEELTAEDDVVTAVGIGGVSGQPLLSFSLTHSLDELVLDDVKIYARLLALWIDF
jgi:hypothetical protein